MRRSLLALAGIVAAGGPALSLQTTWLRRPPLEARQTGAFERTDLDESSGLAPSVRHRGILWTIEDSGNDPVLFATDTLGRDRGRWRVAGAENDDWEAVSTGPCGGRTCIYIADTGDNRERRDHATIYRMREPAPLDAESSVGGEGEITARERLRFTYPDGPRDVEAMLVAPDGSVLLVSKGRSGRIRAYRLPPSAWAARGTPAAQALGPLPLPATGAVADRVTDAALARDGRRVVVRTYVDLYFFELRRGRLVPARPPVACGVMGLDVVGEGVAWRDDGAILLSAEGALGVRGGISVVRCPGR